MDAVHTTASRNSRSVGLSRCPSDAPEKEPDEDWQAPLTSHDTCWTLCDTLGGTGGCHSATQHRQMAE